MAFAGPGESWIGKIFGGKQEPKAPLADMFPDQAADNPMLQYFKGNMGAAQQAAAALMGERPEADYRMALANLGLGILSQPGGQHLATVIGKAGQQALPSFAAARQEPEKWEDRQKSLAASLLTSGWEQEAAGRAAASERAADLEDWQYKQQYKAMLDDAKPQGIGTYGDVMVDKDAYKDNLRSGMDRKAAFNNAIVGRNRPAAQDNMSHLQALKRNAAQLEAMGDPAAADAWQAVDEFRNMVGANEDAKQVTWYAPNEDGLLMPMTAPADKVGDVQKQMLSAERAEKVSASQEGTDDVLAMTSRLLDLVDNSSILSTGSAGGIASSLSAWGKAADEAMSPERKKQFNDLVGENPINYINKLREDDAARTILTPEYLNELEKMGKENQQMASNYLRLAFVTAKNLDESGRLSAQDVAQAMRIVGFNEGAMFNDPTRMKAALLENARNAMINHQRKLRFADMDPEEDFVFKQAKDYGFNWTGGAKPTLTYGDTSRAGNQPPPAQPQAPEPTVYPGAPEAGTVMDGYRFKGGNPADPSNWEQVVDSNK